MRTVGLLWRFSLGAIRLGRFFSLRLQELLERVDLRGPLDLGRSWNRFDRFCGTSFFGLSFDLDLRLQLDLGGRRGDLRVWLIINFLKIKLSSGPILLF